MSQHLAAWMMKVLTILCSYPCPPTFLDTSSICIIGDSRSLYCKGGRLMDSTLFSTRVGYSLVIISNIFCYDGCVKHVLIDLHEMNSTDQQSLECVSSYFAVV